MACTARAAHGDVLELEVGFVVAKAAVGDWQPVERGHHGGALVHAGENARRQKVAALRVAGRRGWGLSFAGCAPAGGGYAASSRGVAWCGQRCAPA
eukprot:scaffold8370_cov101-Isochrysis_galbana.AAC.1